MTLPAWPWLLMVGSAALAIHGGWRAFKAQTAAPAKYELPTTDYDECLACQ